MAEKMLPVTRREFGLSLGALSAWLPAAAASPSSMPWAAPAQVKKIYLAVPVPSWPKPTLDVQQEKADVEARLAELERKHPGLVSFTGGELVRTPEDAQACVKGLGDVDAVLIIDLTSGTGGMLKVLREIQQPTLLFSRPYSGWSYVDVTNWVQGGKRADLIVSSEYGDLDPYMRIFYTIHHLRRSKILVVGPSTQRGPAAEAFTNYYGTAIEYPGYQVVKAAYEAADAAQAAKAAEEFTRGALKVIEPSRQDIQSALRFYLAMVNLLKDQKANAITIDCLGGFRRGDLPAYPCVAWSKLNDAGFYGVCEADLLSTISQLALTSFTGKPGFVTDPVFDTSRNEIIHAHCVSATAMQGLGGPASPYILRSHMEDNKGVSMQVLVPIGDTVTVGKFLNPKKFVYSTGEVLGNVDYDRGCRTKFRTRVGDARKLLENFTGGLHRVVVYGDYTASLRQMSRLMGFELVKEG